MMIRNFPFKSRVYFILYFILCMGAVYGLPRDSVTPEESGKIRELCGKLEQAFRKGDPDIITEDLSETVNFFDYEGKSAVLEVLPRLLKGLSGQLPDMEIRIGSITRTGSGFRVSADLSDMAALDIEFDEAFKISKVAITGASGDSSPADAPLRKPIPPRRFVTRHEGVFSGQKMGYTVVAGDIVLRNAEGEAIGSIFSFSYIKDNDGPSSQRPVLFCFNGGPGSSSIWEHMGILGPRLPALDGVNGRQTAPYTLADNPDCPLSVTDLVFIDPVGTGFSRYHSQGGPADFYGVHEDVDAFIQFIERWLTAFKRWDSPKFIIGESYGTTRANLLAKRLVGGVWDGVLRGISLNGVILLGGTGGLAQPEGNELFQIQFPTWAATAWYHERADRAGRTFEEFVREADQFAASELVPALDAGDALDPGEKKRIAGRMSGFIGLSEASILAQDLRVQNFQKQLLADQGLEVGVYDSRYTLPLAGSAGDPVGDDPAMGQYTAPFVGAFNAYIQGELGVEIDDSYIVIAFKDVNLKWKRSGGDPGGALVTAMRRNPQLHLMSAQGWFDLGGAVGAAEFGIARRGLPRERVTSKFYLSGHMCYVGEAGKIFAADLRDFIVKASR